MIYETEYKQTPYKNKLDLPENIIKKICSFLNVSEIWTNNGWDIKIEYDLESNIDAIIITTPEDKEYLFEIKDRKVQRVAKYDSEKRINDYETKVKWEVIKDYRKGD